MCGICGIYYTDGQRVDPDVLKKMTDTLIHRGPDDEGYYVNSPMNDYGPKWFFSAGHGAVGLGHRRLSIIDLSSGQQPMSSADGKLWIVFNGEIYNYPALKKQLTEKGHCFRTNSDTEVIIYAYREWGEDCVNHLRGMFAFAIWNRQKEELFLARDRLGIKPLYYYWDGRQIIFGSEIKAILAHPGIDRQIEPTAVADYFALMYVPAPKSIFKNISKLPAGYTLVLKPESQPIIKQYWDLQFAPDTSITEEQWCERIIDKLRESIDIRTLSEVPLGAFLSGGIDSSAVVALLSGLSNDPVKTSSIGFSNDQFNELPYAHEIVDRYATDHHEMIVEADAVAILDELTWFYDEPFGDSSAIPTYYVSKITRENVTVALSGDGGDENFAGYRRYYFDQLENRLRGVFPDVIRQTLIAGLANVYPKADWLPQMFRAKTLLSNLAMSPMQGYYNSMSWFGRDKMKLFSPEFRQQLQDYDPGQLFEKHGQNAGGNDPLSRIQYVDVKTYLVDDILTKVDRASMANSLEVRVPLLDHEFMELIATMPSGLKLKGRDGKHILKQALRPFVNASILDRSKRGFSIPLKDWLRKELKPVFEDSVLSGNSIVMDYLDHQYVNTLWKEHQSGMRDYAFELWAVLFFAKWSKKFQL
jgi:asparagine synthase (glutamine-hydrolysing)